MFVVVWPFLSQNLQDATCISNHALEYHAIRRPAPRIASGGLGGGGARPGGSSWGPSRRPVLDSGKPPLQVYPLSAVLRAVRVTPAAWPVMYLTQSALFGDDTPAARSAAHTREQATCKKETDVISVFWPPVRNTFLPGPAPARADGANEEPFPGVPDDSESPPAAAAAVGEAD